MCYKVRADYAGKLEAVVRLLVNKTGIKLATDGALDEASKPWAINGADGSWDFFSQPGVKVPAGVVR